MEEISKIEEKKVVPLKSTADKIEISDEEIKRIREASMEEYNSIYESTSGTKSKVPAILILTGIIVLLALIFKTVTKTSETTDARISEDKNISITVNENGDIISSEQHIPNE